MACGVAGMKAGMWKQRWAGMCVARTRNALLLGAPGLQPTSAGSQPPLIRRAAQVTSPLLPSHLGWPLPCQAQQASGADIQINNLAPAEVGLGTAQGKELNEQQIMLAGGMGANHSSPMPRKAGVSTAQALPKKQGTATGDRRWLGAKVRLACE